jgi:hypothetical protein
VSATADSGVDKDPVRGRFEALEELADQDRPVIAVASGGSSGLDRQSA